MELPSPDTIFPKPGAETGSAISNEPNISRPENWPALVLLDMLSMVMLTVELLEKVLDACAVCNPSSELITTNMNALLFVFIISFVGDTLSLSLSEYLLRPVVRQGIS